MLNKRKRVNKRKNLWMLIDVDELIDNFITRSKKIRIVMFIIINLISISLLPILAICINYPYGYICWTGVLSISALFNIKSYHVHAERYPLNDYAEYRFNPLKDDLIEIDKNFIIVIERKSNIYEVKLKEKNLIFDMKGCLFPLTIINAYLGRQFIAKCINKYKLISETMGKNINVLKLFKNYMNVQIIFNDKNKTKKYFLIKNGKTKMNSFMKSINGYGYITLYFRYCQIDKCYRKISEQDFVKRKMYYNKN